MSQVSIFAHTHAEYSEKLVRRLGRGKLLAGELYRQWFKKGSLNLDEPAFVQAKLLVQSILDETDFGMPECVSRKAEGETYKFLLRTHDKYEIESVRIPMKSQETLCVSSQVGCRMGCSFCETGRMGLLRNLTANEIVSQVFTARFGFNFAIRNIVFMGMGEPFDNYDEVKQAIYVLADQNGLAFGQHRITVSTSGKVDGILRLAEEPEIAPNLAVSITAANDTLRSKLMPHNRKEPLGKVRDAIGYYCHKKSRQVLVAYVLLKGINDTLSHADELIAYLEGLDVKVNLIPYNAQSIDRFQVPESEAVDIFAAHLRNSGLRVLLRQTKGDKIMAACGQLGNAAIRQKIV